MKRALKVIGIIAAVLVLLLVIAGVAATLFIDPNQYRKPIADLVERQTGRAFAIEGELDLSLFPWIGLEVGQVQLGNASGFGPEPFARVEQVEARVRLLPLLRRKVEMDTVFLRGLRLNLARNASGKTNWDDLVAAAEQAPEPKPEQQDRPAAGLAGLALGGLRLTDTRVSWSDQVSGQRAEIAELSLTSGALAPGEPFPLELEFRLSASQPELAGRVALEAMAMVDPAAERYRLEDMVLTTRLDGAVLPTGSFEGRLAAGASADLKADTARLESLQLTAYGAKLSAALEATGLSKGAALTGELAVVAERPEALAALLGQLTGMQVKSEALQGASFKTPLVASLAEGTAELSRIALAVAGVNARLDAKVTGLTGDPVAAGQLQVEPFVPRDTLALFGVDIETAEPSALTKADLSTRYRAGAQVAALDALELRLDETRLTGSASVRRFAAPLIRFDLAVDGVDVDRYLPPSSEGAPPATPAAVAGAGAAQLPLAMLRGMDVQGQLRVGTLKAANLRSSDVQASLQGKEGLYRLHPAGAKLYQGSYTGDMTFDVRQELPRIAMDEKLTGVQAGPLLQDLMGRPYVSGTANVSAAVNARGLTPEQVKQTLNGQAAFAFRDGAVDGINVGLLIRKALAAAQGQKAPADEVKQTDFAALGGTLTIKDGLVRNEDLSAKSPLLRVEGEGSVNLVTEAVDYLIRTAVVGTAEGQGGKELEQLKGLTVPLRIKGTFSDPKFSVELDKALEQRAQEALKKEQKKLEERLKKGLEDKLKGLLR